MTAIAVAIELLPSLWVERLVHVAVLNEVRQPAAERRQLQAHRAMPEGEASRP